MNKSVSSMLYYVKLLFVSVELMFLSVAIILFFFKKNLFYPLN